MVMAEEKKEFPLKDLEWKKTPNFEEKSSDIMVIITSERFINLDFGSFDYEGREPKTMIPTEPFISYHTRIRVPYEHFKEIVKVLTDILKREETTRREKR